MLAIFALIFGLLFILSLLGIFIYSIVLRKKKELREERESFDTSETSKLGHTGYVESEYALIHKESSKIIIRTGKSKVIDTLQKMYDLELTSVDVSDVTGLTPLGGRMENMVLLSYKLEREGLYKLIELNKEE
ncbi:hypothetical protein [Staphylococcus phage vB_SauM-V1SA15]|nr:hypothetical protein [Staphylococcus phage vB_SauM-V1SA15]